MGKLSPVSWKQLVSKLKSFGFDGPYSGGKHPFMIKGDLVLSLPNPHRKQIGVDLLSRILKVAGISRHEWVKS
ncbi:MAG TPA: type II toxin-antitoxin system HicA family toxin [Thermodesulfobacteriota bacterium]|nr:type II toxin-antitoxin system HicA family toxin [Thermodesulfobacteriota bacterium]